MLRAAAVLLVVWLPFADGAGEGLEIHRDDLNFSGGAEAAIPLRVPEGSTALIWQTNLRGAVLQKGTLDLPAGARQAEFRVTCPQVRLAAEMTVWVEVLPGRAEAQVRLKVFPPFDGGASRDVAGKLRIGLAETEPRLARFFDLTQAEHVPASTRLALQSFSGGALIVDGGWLADPGRELETELRAFLKQGGKILCLRPPVGGGVLESAEAGMAMASDPAMVADPRHRLAASANLLNGWRGWPVAKRQEPASTVSLLNQRVILVQGGHAVLEERWPVEGGRVLLLDLPVAERLADEPAAARLLEACLEDLALAQGPAWTGAASHLPREHAFSKILRRLGVQTSAPKGEVPSRPGVLFVAPDDSGSEVLRKVEAWLDAGGHVVTPLVGACRGPTEGLVEDELARGVPLSWCTRLASDLPDGATPLSSPLFGKKGQAVLPGVAERYPCGKGFVYLLRLGREEQLRGGLWLRWLSVLMTNLGVRLGSAGTEMDGKGAERR